MNAIKVLSIEAKHKTSMTTAEQSQLLPTTHTVYKRAKQEKKQNNSIWNMLREGAAKERGSEMKVAFES